MSLLETEMCPNTSRLWESTSTMTSSAAVADWLTRCLACSATLICAVPPTGVRARTSSAWILLPMLQPPSLTRHTHTPTTSEPDNTQHHPRQAAGKARGGGAEENLVSGPWSWFGSPGPPPARQKTSEMLNFPTEPHSQIRLDHILKSDLDPILKQCETSDITSQLRCEWADFLFLIFFPFLGFLFKHC